MFKDAVILFQAMDKARETNEQLRNIVAEFLSFDAPYNPVFDGFDNVAIIVEPDGFIGEPSHLKTSMKYDGVILTEGEGETLKELVHQHYDVIVTIECIRKPCPDNSL